MTGVDGRPEVIIEGSHFLDSGWKEYEFLYKPGNISIRPSVVGKWKRQELGLIVFIFANLSLSLAYCQL